MQVFEFLNENHIINVLTDPNNREKLFVIDCSATWCGPCKSFSKFYQDFVKNYPKTDLVNYYELNVDDVPDFCQDNNISSVPTILFIKNSEEVDRVTGADQNKFKNVINKYLQTKSNPSITKI